MHTCLPFGILLLMTDSTGLCTQRISCGQRVPRRRPLGRQRGSGPRFAEKVNLFGFLLMLSLCKKQKRNEQ